MKREEFDLFMVGHRVEHGARSITLDDSDLIWQELQKYEQLHGFEVTIEEFIGNFSVLWKRGVV